jgi:hypothetical protein
MYLGFQFLSLVTVLKQWAQPWDPLLHKYDFNCDKYCLITMVKKFDQSKPYRCKFLRPPQEFECPPF